MPITSKIEVEDGIIGIFQMSESIEKLEQDYYTIFGQQAPITGFKNDRRKREWIAVRLLIAEQIGNKFTLSYSKEGKPILSGSDFSYISISHSGEYAVVYLHKHKKIGIDIEGLNRKYAAIERKYLSDIELQQVRDDNMLRAIYWCCKEAIFKMADQPGIDFREQIKIEAFDSKKTTIIHAKLFLSTTQTINLEYHLFDEQILVYTF